MEQRQTSRFGHGSVSDLEQNYKPTVKLDVGGSHLIKAHQEVFCRVPGSRLQ